MRKQRGFTFVEMMVVAVIIVIILLMAIPMYQKQVTRSREAVLKSNLFTMRVAINQFKFDRQAAPHSLDDLVAGGYLKDLPMDPITGQNTTWKAVPEDSSTAMDPDSPGIMDVKSGSVKLGLDGTRYADW